MTTYARWVADVERLLHDIDELEAAVREKRAVSELTSRRLDNLQEEFDRLMKSPEPFVL